MKSIPQPAITCSKLTTETLEQGVNYVQIEICGRQPLKNLMDITSNFLKGVFHKFHLVHS